MDGVKTTAIQNFRGSDGGGMVIRFKGTKLEAYVLTPEIVDNEAAPVRIRFDDGSPTRQSWSRASDYRAVFASNPRDLITKLQTSSRFYIEYKPFQKIPQTIIFDVSGLTVPQALLDAYDKRHKQDQAASQKRFDDCLKEQRPDSATDEKDKEYCREMTR
jgi:hypothetical protein